MKNLNCKNLLLCLVATISLQACLSTKGLTGIVKNKILPETVIVSQLDTNFLKLTTDMLQPTDSMVSVDRINSYFIPAIVIWSKNNTLGCTINNQYFISIFTDKLAELSEEFRIKDILNGRKLEISIEAVPNRFIYSDKFTFMFLFYIYSYSFQESISPENGQLKVTFRVLETNSVLKSGTFEANNLTPPESNFRFTRTGFIENYIDNLKYNYEQQCIEIINKIFQEVG